jgi:hypothetical protein
MHDCLGMGIVERIDVAHESVLMKAAVRASVR